MDIARKDIEKAYKKYIKERTNGSMLSAELMLSLSLKLFEAYKIEGLEITDPDDDMLLFQYGTHNWGGSLGRHFSIDVTRQFIMDNDGDMYQLAVELVYAPDFFGTIPSFNCWSNDYENLNDWAAAMRETEGFKLANTMEARLLKVELDKL